MPRPATARGPVRDDAPWYSPAPPDSVLRLAFGATYVPSPTTGTVFQGALGPWRRGPFRLAATWSYVYVRSTDGEAFGFGDPKLFARLRLAGRDSTWARLYVEGGARIPTASAKLFPFAYGGQELDLQGVVAFGRRTHLILGGGGSWTEPGKGMQSSDVPHSVRGWAQCGHVGDVWAAQLRGDYWDLEDGGRREAVEGGVTYIEPDGLRITVAGGAEIGPEADRALDSFVHLRFAMRLR
jgi:hypothetical protein